MESEEITNSSPSATGDTGPDPRRWKALAVLGTAYFMVTLDAQIVAVALPSIQDDLGFSTGNAQWVFSAYLLTFGGLLMLGGRAADLLGRRRLFMVGTSLFLVSSLVCGIAWTGGVLITARAVQGMSAAIMVPTALSILMTTFYEGSERNKALGVWTALAASGATAALLIGGPLTDWLGWEWIFLINIPVATAMLALSPVLLRESRDRGRRRAFDPAGAATITAALVLLVYAVVEAPDAGWSSGQTTGLLAGSAALLLLFTIIEARSAAPLVPLRIFRSRALVGGNAVMVVLGTVVFGMGFTLTQYAQQVLGYSAVAFGLGTVVYAVMAVIGSAIGQAVATRAGFRAVGSIAGVGMFLVTVGCLLLTQVSADGSYFEDIFFGLLVFGPGLGACFVAAAIAALTGVSERESGLASGINNATFQIGGALGVAITSSVAVSYTAGPDPLVAMAAGFQAAFVACAVVAAIGLLVVFVFLRQTRRPSSSGRD